MELEPTTGGGLAAKGQPRSAPSRVWGADMLGNGRDQVMARTLRRRNICILAMAITVTSTIPAWGADDKRHSGTVRAVDRAGGTFVLEELGPLRMTRSVAMASAVATTKAATEVTRLKIALEPSTEVFFLTRATGLDPNEWAGDFVRTRSGVGALISGAFVTVTLTRRGQALVADRVEVMVPETLNPDLAAPSGVAVRPQ